MRSVLFVVVSLVCGVSFGQQYQYPVQNYQYAPQTQFQVAPGAPMPVPSMPALPVHEWREGFREEWKTVHEIRPVRSFEAEGYRPAYQSRNDGYFWNPSTGCWQRDCQQVYPQWQFYYPQQYQYQQPYVGRCW